MEQGMAIGVFGVSIILSIMLRMIYNTINIPSKLKPWLAITIGIGLGIVVMYYNLDPKEPIAFKLVIDHILGGFMTGATAVGMYEMTKSNKI